jgi:hypothetical protein
MSGKSNLLKNSSIMKNHTQRKEDITPVSVKTVQEREMSSTIKKGKKITLMLKKKP